MTTTILETVLENNSQITIADSNTKNTISATQSLNVSEDDDLTIYSQYHQSEIKQNDKIYNVARGIIWAGFGVMMLGVVICFLGKIAPAIITTISGVITELISGTIFVFLSQSTKSKMSYYKQLSFDEECKRYIKAIQNLDDDKKTEMLDKLISNYCERRK